jgi:hypothetical protein
MPSKAGAVKGGLQCKIRLPCWCTTQNIPVLFTEIELLANAVNLLLCYAIGWKFISVENAFDAGQFCSAGEFTPESRELGSLLIVGFCSKVSKKAIERQCHHDRAAGEAVGHHAGLRASKDFRNVMKVKWERLGYSLSNGLFYGLVVKVPVGRQRREFGRFSKVVGQPIKVELPSHFEANDLGDPVQVLAPFDFNTVASTNGDVEVLADAAEATANAPRSAQNAPQRHSSGLSMVGRNNVWRRRDFNQRQSQAVKVVNHLLTVRNTHRVQLPGTVFLKAHHINANRASLGFKNAVSSDE